MSIHPITMCLMLLTILNHINVNKMTGRVVVEAFAVKHPSNQASTNDGLRTSCECATASTQLEYANDIEKYDGHADDDDRDEKRWKKRNYQMKLLMANEQQQEQQPSSLIEKTSEHWPDYNSKRWSRDGKHVHLYRLFLKINRNDAFMSNRDTDYELFPNYLNRKILMTSDSSIDHYKINNLDEMSNTMNQSSLKWMSRHRKTRQIHSYDTAPKAKLTSEILSDDAITIVPTAKLDRVLSKLFQESLQQDESLANILHMENSISNVKFNSPSVQALETNKRGVSQNLMASSNSRLQPKEIEFDIDESAKKNMPVVTDTVPTDESLNFHIDRLNRDRIIGITKVSNSIKRINPVDIYNFYRVFNTMPTLGSNYQSIQPRQFVLAPTKFIDHIKILSTPPEFIHADGKNIMKNMRSKENNMQLNLDNRPTNVNGNMRASERLNLLSDIESWKPATSLFVQVSNVSNRLYNTHVLHNDHLKINNTQHQKNPMHRMQSANSPISSPKYNNKISIVNLDEINNKADEPNTSLNYPRYAEKYEFDYRVIDDKAGNYFGHRESRNEGVTNGQYHVLLPDGRIQEVKYRVDKSGGYRANVTYHNQVYG